MNDLDVLYPTGIDVTVGKELVSVTPITFGMLPAVTKFLAPVVKALTESGVVQVVEVPGEDGTSARKLVFAQDAMSRLSNVLEIGGEPVVCLIAAAIKKPRAFMDSVALDEGISLAKAIIEVNADLLLKKVLPMLGMNMNAAPTPAPDGGLLSENLSQEGTTLQT